MLLTRLYLRNFRVYEDELDLALPPGLVGIYGPNGAGKSTLLEAVNFALWGKARTDRAEIRSAGVGGDCVVEVEFEHEGHLYLVRRWLTGINSTMKAEAHCDGLVMAEGSTDSRRYVGSVLGMDDAAFRASVFAEQKQLAAFSDQAPAERRRLVLQLLGITPLDAARDAARRDAREREAQLTQLRSVLPDLDALVVEAADADAAAAAAETVAAEERVAAETATAAEVAAQTRWATLDELRQAWDGLVLRGQAARKELDGELRRAEELTAELRELDAAAGELAGAEAGAAGLEEARARLAALLGLLDARVRLDAVALGPEPPDPLPAEQQAAVARRASGAAAEVAAEIAGRLTGATGVARLAAEQLERSASLRPDADCPLCGQPLGEAWTSVQDHRREELEAARALVEQLQTAHAGALDGARRAVEAAEAAERRAGELARAHREWELARATRANAEDALRSAAAAAAGVGVGGSVGVGGGGAGTGGPTGVGDGPADLERLRADELDRLVAIERGTVTARESSATTATTLRGRLGRRPAVEASLATAEQRIADARREVEALRDQVRTLGFDREALASAASARDAAVLASRAAARSAQEAEVAAGKRRTQAEERAARLAEGRASHGRLGELEGEARHLARLAALLSEFRNTVVASVGPRLAAQAADLFGELTDREYDQLLVDPETYELQISDAGRVYGLDRFSGSEIDLANLALRVAISEHVRFQSGGSVGLLVLDEVFGPLDEDRKARMLQALEQLRGRFRQVLVVTHDNSIKEQLPNALEVVKLPGRRATARLLG